MDAIEYYLGTVAIGSLLIIMDYLITPFYLLSKVFEKITSILGISIVNEKMHGFN